MRANLKFEFIIAAGTLNTHGPSMSPSLQYNGSIAILSKKFLTGE